MALAIAIAQAPALSASEWEDVKDPAALHALWANKTHKGTDWMDKPIVAYYRDDGTALLLYRDTQIPARWSVKGADQVCVVWGPRLNCYRTQRNTVRPGVYQLTDVNSDVQREYSIEVGIPKF